MIYAVIDTNVVISAVLSRLRSDANTAKVLEYVFSKEVISVYNQEIIEEYIEVLSREKFRFDRRLSLRPSPEKGPVRSAVSRVRVWVWPSPRTSLI